MYRFPTGSAWWFFFVFFFFPYNTLCASGPHREVVGSVYPQKQEPHLGHTVLGYSAWPGPSSPASCFDTAPPFSAAVKKNRPQVARQPVIKLFFFLAVLYFQFLACEFDLIKTTTTSDPFLQLLFVRAVQADIISVDCVCSDWLVCCFLQPLNCALCPIRRRWTNMASKGWTNPTTWSWRAGMYKNTSLDSVHTLTHSWNIHYLLIRQRSAVLEVDDSSHKHSLLHQWLQRIRTLLHNTADLQRDCQRDRTVPVLLQRPESRRWQNFSCSLCVCPRYNSF